MDAFMRARFEKYPTDPVGAFLVWNARYVKHQLCAGSTIGSMGILSEFYEFDPADGSEYPIFRHLPHISPPGWFVTNAFGWRGPDLAQQKAPNTIRIAFVGASTTVSGYGLRHSHPEFIGHWLDLWAVSRRLPYRFEVINTGRTGISSASVAAIVRQELPPIDPDLVIYEVANDFSPGQTLRTSKSVPPQPTAPFMDRTGIGAYSALAVRVRKAVTFVGRDGAEPQKPPSSTVWPVDVDEHNPDVTHATLPMGLDAVVSNLNVMRKDVDGMGAEFAISSSVWMVFPGMTLDLRRHLTLYQYLNHSYWPASYAHLRRMADFQNVVFANYAKVHRLMFFDVAAAFPLDPDLFVDAIHKTEDGLRLQAWIYFQQIVGAIDKRLRDHRWPRAPHAGPAPVVDVAPRLVDRKEILASCR